MIGKRGSGKSTLLEAAACLLGDLSGEPWNDATSAGLRQARNNQARPLLIDEFEPDGSSTTSAKQKALIALARAMSGGSGGRIARGSADHSAVSFRMVGATYVTSINHIQLEPQDRSRFAILQLNALPKTGHPEQSQLKLEQLLKKLRDLSARFRGHMLKQSSRWDRTVAKIKARAMSLGADARQAETAAAILAGLDLALFKGDIDELRLEDLMEPLSVLIGDPDEAEEESEGQQALDFLLSRLVRVDHGLERSVQELITAAIKGKSIDGVVDPVSFLDRYGIYVLKRKSRVALWCSTSSQLTKVFSGSKWADGACKTALKQLDGVEEPKNAVRIYGRQKRVLLANYACFGL